MGLESKGAVVLIEKLLGKTCFLIGEDLAKLYKKGRDKIIEKAEKKIKNKNDGKSSNLRVTRDVFWNGAYTDEAICAEYFGGILASSRSEDGKDDSNIYYVDLIKSLSTKQLKLHYLIYSSFNKAFSEDVSKKELNPGQETELSKVPIFLLSNEICNIVNDSDFGKDLHVLHAKGLIYSFKSDFHKVNNNKIIQYLKVTSSSLGIQLYAVSHNKSEEWRTFTAMNFGIFEDISKLKLMGFSIQELLDSIRREDI